MRKLGGAAVAVTAVMMVLIGCASVVPPAETPASSTSPTIPATASATPAGVPSAEASVPGATVLDTAQPTTPTAVPTSPPTETSSPRKTPKPTKSVTPTKTPTATPAQNSPAIVTFDVTPTDVDCSVNPLPTTVHAEWSVKNATGVTISIDGGGAYKTYVGTTGSDDVAWSCGSAQHEYKLATTGGSGTAAQQTLTVKRAVPIIDEFFGPTIVAPGPCDKIWHVSLHYTVFNATGATIETNGQILGNYTGKSNDVPVDFDCRNNNISQLYKLTTIDNYGPPATLETYITYDGS